LAFRSWAATVYSMYLCLDLPTTTWFEVLEAITLSADCGGRRNGQKN